MKNLEIIEKIEKLLNDGKTYNEIANEIGINNQTGRAFVSYLVRLGIVQFDESRINDIEQIRRQKIKNAKKENRKAKVPKDELEKLLRKKVRYNKIAEKLNVSCTLIRKMIYEYGLCEKDLLEHLKMSRNIDITQEELDEYFSSCGRGKAHFLKLQYNEHLKQAEIARMYNVSREYIRQIIAKEENILVYQINTKKNEKDIIENLKNENPYFAENNCVLVDSLSLSVKPYNALKRNGIEYIPNENLETYQQLLSLNRLGKKSAEEIKNKLSEYGIILKE